MRAGELISKAMQKQACAPRAHQSCTRSHLMCFCPPRKALVSNHFFPPLPTPPYQWHPYFQNCVDCDYSCWQGSYCCGTTAKCAAGTCLLNRFTETPYSPKTCTTGGATSVCAAPAEPLTCDISGTTCQANGGSSSYCMGRTSCLDLSDTNCKVGVWVRVFKREMGWGRGGGH